MAGIIFLWLYNFISMSMCFFSHASFYTDGVQVNCKCAHTRRVGLVAAHIPTVCANNAVFRSKCCSNDRGGSISGLQTCMG